MKKYILEITICLLLFFTVGCKKTIIGKWKSLDEDNYYYIFNKDKTCSYEMSVARLDCTYEDNDGKLNIKFNGDDKTNKYEYYFNKNTLIIKDGAGKEYKFNKKR